jgi:hypothetical protein
MVNISYMRRINLILNNSFTHSYVFIALSENLPSVKIQSNEIQKACAFFLTSFTLMEKDFDADEGKIPDTALLTVYPNGDLVKKLKLREDHQYKFMVVEEESLKKIDQDFWEQFNY